MSYDGAKDVRDSVWEMLRYNKSVVMVGVENVGGQFGVVVGSTHPKDVDVPKELDNIPIRVIEMQPPSPYEPRD